MFNDLENKFSRKWATAPQETISINHKTAPQQSKLQKKEANSNWFFFSLNIHLQPSNGHRMEVNEKLLHKNRTIFGREIF